MVGEYKIALLGSEGVGKSTITVQYVQGIFVTKYDPSIEDTYRKQVVVDQIEYLLEILDTARIGLFSMRDLKIRDVDAFLLVYAINSKSSFNELPDHRDYLSRVNQKDYCCILVGNKSDLEDERVITKEELKELSNKWDYPSFETSSKLFINIQEAFLTLIGLITKKRDQKVEKKKN